MGPLDSSLALPLISSLDDLGQRSFSLQASVSASKLSVVPEIFQVSLQLSHS